MAVKLTFDGLIRALRTKAHDLPDERVVGKSGGKRRGQSGTSTDTHHMVLRQKPGPAR